jgi:RNA polymerase sigma-70 factor (ECF subfamily)
VLLDVRHGAFPFACDPCETLLLLRRISTREGPVKSGRLSPLKEDTDIIKRVQDGDSDAFSSLVVKYHRGVYNLAYRYTGNQEDAMDVTQETFLRAYRNIDSFQLGKPFKPWIFRIARNVCIDRGRKLGRSLPEESLEGNVITQVRASSPAPGPEQVYDKRELREILEDAIRQLDEGYRELIILFHLEGLSIKECSEITGLKGTVIKNRLYRGRQALRKILQENDFQR